MGLFVFDEEEEDDANGALNVNDNEELKCDNIMSGNGVNDDDSDSDFDVNMDADLVFEDHLRSNPAQFSDEEDTKYASRVSARRHRKNTNKNVPKNQQLFAPFRTSHTVTQFRERE